MPATHFLCPDKVTIPIAECLNGKCRIADEVPGGRCLSIRTLRFIAEQRPWAGKPSTTQLIKGTREAFLELTTDYAIDPQQELFRIRGSNSHSLLEQFVDPNELSEERLHDKFSSGQFDFYDSETQTLYDNKFTGSYKVMKALGYRQLNVPTGEKYKTGVRKGQPKTRKEWTNGGRRDVLDWTIQLNDYRMKLEQILPKGYSVKQMFVECVIRDGGTYMAKQRNIQQNGVLIPIRKISNHWIATYMQMKSEALMYALETGETPRHCSFRERWRGRKCNGSAGGEGLKKGGRRKWQVFAKQNGVKQS